MPPPGLRRRSAIAPRASATPSRRAAVGGALHPVHRPRALWRPPPQSRRTRTCSARCRCVRPRPSASCRSHRGRTRQGLLAETHHAEQGRDQPRPWVDGLFEDPAVLIGRDVAPDGRGRAGVGGIGVAGFGGTATNRPVALRDVLAGRHVRRRVAGTAALAVRPRTRGGQGIRQAGVLRELRRAVQAEGGIQDAAGCRRAARYVLTLGGLIAVARRHSGTCLRIAARAGGHHHQGGQHRQISQRHRAVDVPCVTGSRRPRACPRVGGRPPPASSPRSDISRPEPPRAARSCCSRA